MNLRRVPGVVFGLLHPVGDYAQGLFEEPGCFFAIGSLEVDGIDFDFTLGRNNDFNSRFH